MTFDEICKVDFRPFKESIISKYNYRNLQHNQGVGTIFYYAFVYQYFSKINEKYNTSFWRFKIADTTLNCVFNHDMDSVGFNHTLSFLESAMEDCFLQTIDDIGFECCSSMLLDSFADPRLWNNNRTLRKHFMKMHLDRAFPKGHKSWIPLYWYMLDNICSSLEYVPTGRMYLLRNREMGEYFNFCEKYYDIVNGELSAESEAINRILLEVCNPFSYYCTKDYGLCGKYVYFYFDVGKTNYGLINFLQLRPSWLLACFVYKNLMQDFKEKVSGLCDKYPELRDEKWT